MVDTTEASGITLEQAINSGRKARKLYEPFWRQFRRELTGPYYQKGKGERRITNYLYLYASTYLPQLVSKKNASFGVTAQREFTDFATALAHKLAINQVARATELKSELRLAAMDSFCGPGIIKTGLYAAMTPGAPESAEPGNFYSDPGHFEPTMPFGEHIPQASFLWDDQVTDFRRCNYMGHEFDRDYDSVMSDPRYDVSGLEDVASASIMADDETKKEQIEHYEGDVPKFLHLIELYVRPTRTLYTVLETSKKTFHVLRKVPYYGPPDGPYHMLGYLPVPGKVMPLAPCAAWMAQLVEYEKQEEGMNEQAQSEKRFVAFDSGQHEAAQLAQQVKNNGIVVGAMGGKEIVWGGITNERDSYVRHCRELLERMSGVSDINLGVSDDSSTATGASLVNQNKNLRVSDMQECMLDFVEEIATDWLYYIHNEPTFSTQVTMQNPNGLPTEVLVIGGPQTDANGQPVADQPDWTQFAVTVDAKTLFADNSQQEQMIFAQNMQIVTTALLPILQMQGFTLNGVDLTKMTAKKLNWPELGGMVIALNPMAQQMQQMSDQNEVDGGAVESLATTKDPMQTQVQNAPDTNAANSQATQVASPQRQAVTQPGANNKETSFG